MSLDLEKFDKLNAELKIFVSPVFDLKVTDDETGRLALDAGSQIKGFQKRVEQLRKDLVGPLNDRVKEINAHAKRVMAPLEQAEAHIKKELMARERELARIREDEFQKAEAERKRKEAEAAELAKQKAHEAEAMAMFGAGEEAEIVKVEAEVAQERGLEEAAKDHKATVRSIDSMKISGARKTWTFKFVDATQLPREYLVPDPTLIRAAIRNGVRAIPGLEIFEETSIALRG